MNNEAKGKRKILERMIIDAWTNGHEQTSPHKGSIDYDADLGCYIDKVSPLINTLCEGKNADLESAKYNKHSVSVSLLPETVSIRDVKDVRQYLMTHARTIKGRKALNTMINIIEHLESVSNAR